MSPALTPLFSFGAPRAAQEVAPSGADGAVSPALTPFIFGAPRAAQEVAPSGADGAASPASTPFTFSSLTSVLACNEHAAELISAVARAFTFGNVPVEPRKRTRQTGVAALECAEDSTENDQVHSAVSTNSQRARQSRRRAAAQGRKGRVTRRRGQRVTLAPAPLKPAPPFRLVSALSRDALSVVVECLGADDLCRFILTAKSSATAAREDGVWSVHLRTMCPSTTQIEYAKAVYSRTLVAGLELRAWVVEQAQPLMVDGASILPANDAGVISSAFDLRRRAAQLQVRALLQRSPRRADGARVSLLRQHALRGVHVPLRLPQLRCALGTGCVPRCQRGRHLRVVRVDDMHAVRRR